MELRPLRLLHGIQIASKKMNLQIFSCNYIVLYIRFICTLVHKIRECQIDRRWDLKNVLHALYFGQRNGSCWSGAWNFENGGLGFESELVTATDWSKGIHSPRIWEWHSVVIITGTWPMVCFFTGCFCYGAIKLALTEIYHRYMGSAELSWS